jgi:HEAT repeat protein
MSFPSRCAASVSLLCTDRSSLLQAMEALLRSPRDRRACVDALRITQRLRLSNSLDGILLTLAGSEDAFIASCAASAMADIESSEGLDALHALVGHPDARVRANAVDALARRGSGELPACAVSLAASPFNRERGSAVRALLRSNDQAAGSALRSMLRASDPLHRISGVWAARTGRALPAVPDLAHLARTDPLLPVRTRAAAAARFLQRSAARRTMKVA